MTYPKRIWASDDSKSNLTEALKKLAFNKGYVPPDNDIHLARHVIYWYLLPQLERYKKEAIEAKKELSKLRRGK